MKTLRLLLAAFLAASVLTIVARAADVSGTWKWTSATKSGGPTEITAALLLKDGTLTGTVTGRQGPAEISDASVKDGAVAFTVTRGTGDAMVVFKYTGQLNGDAITGAIERSGPKGAAPVKNDWKASRVK